MPNTINSEDIEIGDHKYMRLVYEWSLDAPLIVWMMHDELSNYVKITSNRTILDLEQTYHNI